MLGYAVVAALIAPLASGGNEGGREMQQFVRVLTDAHVQNRDFFHAGWGELLRTEWVASDGLKPAVRSAPSGSKTARLVIAFKGRIFRIDELYDAQVTRSTIRHNENGSISVGYVSRRYLTDGTNTLEISLPVFENQSRQAVLRPGTKWLYAYASFIPLWLGCPEAPGDASLAFGSTMELALRSQFGLTAEYTGLKADASQETHEVVVRKDGKLYRRYLVDLDHGAVPVEVQQYDGAALTVHMICDDLREAAPDHWLPFHIRLAIRIKSGRRPKWLSQDVRVAEWHLGEPPQELMRIALPAGCLFADAVTGRAMELDRPAAFGFGPYASALPHKRSVAISKGGPSPLDFFDMHEEHKRTGLLRPWQWATLAACLALFLLGVLARIGVLRRR